MLISMLRYLYLFNISYQMNFSPRYEWATDYVHKSSEHPKLGKILGALLHELLEMIFYGNLTI